MSDKVSREDAEFWCESIGIQREILKGGKVRVSPQSGFHVMGRAPATVEKIQLVFERIGGYTSDDLVPQHIEAELVWQDDDGEVVLRSHERLDNLLRVT
jgi:hypothetical protein